MTDKPNPLLDSIQRTLRMIREETVRKVRQADFREHRTPEERRRVEDKLGIFTDIMDAIGGKPSEEEE